MFKLKCIKCLAPYEDKEDDAYLCEPCREARQALAKEIDKKIGSTVGQESKSELKAFEELAKAKGGFRGGGNNTGVFLNVKDL